LRLKASKILFLPGTEKKLLVFRGSLILFKVDTLSLAPSSPGVISFAGIHRAVTFQALVMLSKFSIRQDLKIPGAF